MNLWREFRERSAKWGARITVGLVAVIVLCEAAHSLGLLDMWHVPSAAIEQALLVGTITLAFLLIEEFSRTEKSVQVLAEQQAASLNVSRFSGQTEFHSRWKHLRETYDSFTLRGNLGTGFMAEIQKLQQRQKKCTYYLPIDNDSQAVARDFLSLGAKSPAEDYKLYETASFGEPSWMMGRSKGGGEIEVLVCYAPPYDDAISGLHLVGPAARAYAESILATLETRVLDGEIIAPVRLYTESQVEAVLSEKHIFRQAMLDIDKGAHLIGVEDVCRAMETQLKATAKFLDVTHICSEKTIPLLRAPHFIRWLSENYAAAARGVKITRIFILPKALRKNAMLAKLIEEMRDHEITVRICDREKLEDRFLEDFSLYDDEHVIYISREGGAWLEEEQAQARRSDSLERVKHFRHIFDIVQGRAN